MDLRKLTAGELVDMGICPTCFDNENNHCVYGDNSQRLIFKNMDFEVFLVGNPRADGHTAISSIKHYKDMLEIPDDLCQEIFLFAQKCMQVLKEVYKAESVYLCTMCDGPMNHFHIQLIPRYSYEKRGSKNFVKERKVYNHNQDIVNKLRDLLSIVC